MAKLKQFDFIKYYRGIEVRILCVTTSKKKFSELAGISLNDVNNYAHSYEPINKECIESPDKLFAKIGMGGEGIYVFDREQILPYEEYQKLIDTHRDMYPTYSDYFKKTSKE